MKRNLLVEKFLPLTLLGFASLGAGASELGIELAVNGTPKVGMPLKITAVITNRGATEIELPSPPGWGQGGGLVLEVDGPGHSARPVIVDAAAPRPADAEFTLAAGQSIAISRTVMPGDVLSGAGDYVFRVHYDREGAAPVISQEVAKTIE